MVNAGRHWPQAAGRVVGADICHYRTGRGESHYFTEVIYSFDVLGTVFTGKFMEDTFSGIEQAAEEKAAKYPAGMPILVRYNPQKPQICLTDYDRISRREFVEAIGFLITTLMIAAVLVGFSD